MNEIIQSQDRGAPQIFFRQAADFLQHAALASKLLWPPGSPVGYKTKRAKARGLHLRDALKMPDDHVLKGRSLRDHFEHYDERLDDWVVKSPNRIFVNNMIGPRSAIGGNFVQDHEIFKLFDPQTKRLLFRGESFDIQVLMDGLVDILGRAQARLLVLAR